MFVKEKDNFNDSFIKSFKNAMKSEDFEIVIWLKFILLVGD